MKILILGGDGYIGWALTNDLLYKGHEVALVDNISRRRRVEECGSDSAVPIESESERKDALSNGFKDHFIDWINMSLGEDSPGYISSVLKAIKPEAIIHLAEMPSAPWSMMGVQAAGITQTENVIGTLHLLWAMKEFCPEAHLIKLGTMGEYGTPESDIPEGRIPPLCDNIDLPVGCKAACPLGGLLFPRTPGSFYHLSKVMDSFNIEFACRTWGLTSTDIMQGVVFGNEFNTRFDYDECFGTVINRFCAQAVIQHPLTVYGSGNQIRGFLPLLDSLQCINLILNNPPHEGEYRTVNQFENIYKLNDLADMVATAARDFGFPVGITHLPNPRTEAEKHYYNPTHQKLFELGYVPTGDIQAEIYDLIEFLIPFKERIDTEVIKPTINWR
jgi:UDP-sulfoquinovose synthase